MPSILDLIAQDKRNEDNGRNIYPNNNEQFVTPTFNGLIPNEFNLEEIGFRRLNDVKDLNLFKPLGDIYEQFNIDPVPVGVIDSDEIYDYIEPYYENNILKYNKYIGDNRQLYNVPQALEQNNYYSNYNAYSDVIRRNMILRGMSLIDILTGSSLEDSTLGNIAQQSIRSALELNLQNNIFRQTVGRINSDLFSIIDGDPLIREDFSITIPRTPIGRTLDIVSRLQGLTLPFSYIPIEAFDFTQTSLETRNLSLLEYTGKAYKKLIVNNFEKNKYYPITESDDKILPNNVYSALGEDNEFNKIFITFDDDLTPFGVSNRVYVTSKTYSYPIKNSLNNLIDDNLINVSLNNDDYVDESQFNEDWSQFTTNNFSDKSLLYQTKNLVDSGEIFDNFSNTLIHKKNGELISIPRADSTSAKADFTSDDGIGFKKGDYFRTFTKNRKYNRLSRTLRHRGLDNGDKRSVLGDNGLLLFAPTENNLIGEGFVYRKYMLSIANYAWKGNSADLPECEKYIDPNGNIARMMWFAPYDLSFSESVIQTINDHSFFGRGENILTTSNTQRTLNLSFALLIDYPDIINNIAEQETHIWERYFKGDKSVYEDINNIIQNQLTAPEQQELNDVVNKLKKPEKLVNDPLQSDSLTNNPDLNPRNNKNKQDVFLFSVYFPNEVYEIPVSPSLNSGYEDGNGTILNYTYLNGRQKLNVVQYRDQTNYGLNSDYLSMAYDIIRTTMEDAYSEIPDKIEFKFVGHASAAKTTRISNDILAKKRAESVKTDFIKKLSELNILGTKPPNMKIIYNPKSNSDHDDNRTNDDDAGDLLYAKKARRVDVYVNYYFDDGSIDTNEQNKTINDEINDPNYDDQANLDRNVSDLINNLSPNLRKKIINSYCYKFKFMKINESISKKTIAEKIAFFMPAFHSYTPQNFNERLTFLQQCLRSSNNISTSDNPTNLYYGYSPYIYLRIGDFIQTKALITNMSIDYNIYDLQWDMNPESSAGVQPMFAKITLSLILIGGQSMSGPLSRIQNALSFNYYSNTEMYDLRADSLKIKNETVIDEAEIIDGLKLNTINNNEDDLLLENIKIRSEQGTYLSNQIGALNPNNENVNLNESNDLIYIKRILNLEIE